MVRFPPAGLSRLLPRLGPVSADTHVELIPGALGVTLVVSTADDDGRGVPLSVSQIERTGMTPEALLEVAIGNLAEIADVEMGGSSAVPEGVVAVLSDDGRAIDRALLLDHLFDAPPLGGWFVCMPAPDRLLLAAFERLDDVEALQPLRALSGMVCEQLGVPQTSQVFWVHRSHWEPLAVEEPEEGHLRLDPSERLEQTLNRLAVLELAPEAGEA